MAGSGSGETVIRAGQRARNEQRATDDIGISLGLASSHQSKVISSFVDNIVTTTTTTHHRRQTIRDTTHTQMNDQDQAIRLRLNLKNLRRHDQSIIEIIESTSYVVVYTMNTHNEQWIKSNIQGPMFLFKRYSSSSPST